MARRAAEMAATSTGGSPCRRAATTVGTLRPVTRSTAAIYAAHGSGASTAKIERERALPRLQRPQCCHVGARKVEDVDEIALAGAVRGGIVGAQERQRQALPAGCADRERNEVGFRVVALHQLSLGVGSGGIEKRRQAVESPLAAATSARICSQASFDRSYGLMGFCSALSVTGSVAGIP